MVHEQAQIVYVCFFLCLRCFSFVQGARLVYSYGVCPVSDCAPCLTGVVSWSSALLFFCFVFFCLFAEPVDVAAVHQDASGVSLALQEIAESDGAQDGHPYQV